MQSKNKDHIYILFYFCSFYTRPRLKVLFNLSITSNYRSILSWKVLSILCPIRYCFMETTCIITLNIKVVCPYKRHSDFLMHCFPLIENKEKNCWMKLHLCICQTLPVTWYLFLSTLAAISYFIMETSRWWSAVLRQKHHR